MLRLTLGDGTARSSCRATDGGSLSAAAVTQATLGLPMREKPTTLATRTSCLSSKERKAGGGAAKERCRGAVGSTLAVKELLAAERDWSLFAPAEYKDAEAGEMETAAALRDSGDDAGKAPRSDGDGTNECRARNDSPVAPTAALSAGIGASGMREPQHFPPRSQRGAKPLRCASRAYDFALPFRGTRTWKGRSARSKRYV